MELLDGDAMAGKDAERLNSVARMRADFLITYLLNSWLCRNGVRDGGRHGTNKELAGDRAARLRSSMKECVY